VNRNLIVIGIPFCLNSRSFPTPIYKHQINSAVISTYTCLRDLVPLVAEIEGWKALELESGELLKRSLKNDLSWEDFIRWILLLENLITI
jgi:hypothetical protein